MSATPEAKAKKVVRKLLDDAKAYYIMPVTGGYGKSGAPDFVGVHNGRFFGIEVKANTSVTALQSYNLDRIRLAGGWAFVVIIPTKGGEPVGLTELELFLDR